MKYEIHFDVNSIIRINILERREARYGWLPKKQKTFFFNLFKRNSFYPEGFYEDSDYFTYYDGGGIAYSEQDLIKYGYQVDPDKSVWEKPYISIIMKNKDSIQIKFESLEEARNYVKEIEEKSEIKFHVILKNE
jgi:hypothetical protein